MCIHDRERKALRLDNSVMKGRTDLIEFENLAMQFTVRQDDLVVVCEDSF